MAADAGDTGDTAGERQPRGGDNRGGERRRADRRRTDRRTPVPPWRRPAALVAYGVAGTLLVVLAWSTLRKDESDDPGRGAVVTAPPPIDTVATPTPAPAGPVEPALATADFERLTIEGDSARGRMVRAQLFCDAPTPVALQARVDSVESAIASLVDTGAGKRVPGALCKWGAQDDPRREDFLLLVPAAQADAFASAPVVMDGYVRRRRVIANVEWIGKSPALALRTVGIFRGLGR